MVEMEERRRGGVPTEETEERWLSLLPFDETDERRIGPLARDKRSALWTDTEDARCVPELREPACAISMPEDDCSVGGRMVRRDVRNDRRDRAKLASEVDFSSCISVRQVRRVPMPASHAVIRSDGVNLTASSSSAGAAAATERASWRTKSTSVRSPFSSLLSLSSTYSARLPTVLERSMPHWPARAGLRSGLSPSSEKMSSSSWAVRRGGASAVVSYHSSSAMPGESAAG
eukprot:scaffold70548_cov27-Tisochrysis_lutea.AAC.1